MSKSIPGKVNMPKVNVTNINDTVKKSNITKWLPFICAGTAVGVSILALKELKKIKNEMSVVKNQQKIIVVKVSQRYQGGLETEITGRTL